MSVFIKQYTLSLVSAAKWVLDNTGWTVQYNGQLVLPSVHYTLLPVGVPLEVTL